MSIKEKHIKKQIKGVFKDFRNPKKIFRINRLLSNWYVLPIILIIIDIILILGVNYFAVTIGNMSLLSTGKISKEVCFSWKNMFHMGRWKGIYKLLVPVLAVLDVMFTFRIKEAFSDDYFNVGQKGTASWTTLDEIREQYLEIDEKDTPFPGWGGCIVARYEDKLFIDQTDVNNLYIGISRGGKGEIFVVPSIEVYSRAEKQRSLVVIDMKCEHYKMLKQKLIDRGYDVYFMNLTDPEHSMMYNCLTDIIVLWKNGDQANAELLAKATSVMLFSGKESQQGDMKYFSDVASDMCCAMILAAIDDCLSEDDKENQRREIVFKRKQEAFGNLPEEEQEKARALYYETKETSEDVIMERDILAIPSDESFYESNKNEKCINFYSIINIFTEVSNIEIPDSNLTGIDLYFNNRPEFDRAKLRYIGVKVTGNRTKGSIFSEMLRKLGEFTYENIAKMTAESSLDIKNLGFGDKPIAVFLGVPSHDKSKYFLPSVFIRQVYFVIAQQCIEYGKCKRKIKVIGDEIGNFPKMEEADTMLSFGAGLGITFDFYIQDEQQLKKVYGEDYKIIKNNCHNKIWIISNDLETAKEFSSSLGTESITDIQRVGSKFSLHKTYHENVVEKPLMKPEDLMSLQKGECIVIRSTMRTDLKGNDVKPKPIFNSIKNGQRFKYRYQYLTDIKNPEEVRLSEINTEDCSYINPKERVWDYHKTFAKFENALAATGNGGDSSKIRDLPEKKHKSLNKALKKSLGDDVLERWKITNDMEITTLIQLISDTDEIEENQKKPLLNVLEGELGR